MTVKEILKHWLEQNGYDGLCSEECGCELSDLCPCCLGENILSCEPGYKVPCPEDCGDHDWHIAPDKPVAPPEIPEWQQKGDGTAIF